MSNVVRKGTLEVTTRVELYACVDAFASRQEVDDALMLEWLKGNGQDIETFPDKLTIHEHSLVDQLELECE